MKTAQFGKNALDGEVITLSGEKKSLLNDYIKKMPSGMPLVLNMGSYTWPPWACGVDKLLAVYNKYCKGPNNVARMLTIYIEEAHATDEWFFPDAVDVKSGGAVIAVHKNLSDRIQAAKTFVQNKEFPVEIVVDSMKSEVIDRYFAWPERLYIIMDGVVVYKGGMGPNDYLIEEVDDWLGRSLRINNTNGDSTNGGELSPPEELECSTWH